MLSHLRYIGTYREGWGISIAYQDYYYEVTMRFLGQFYIDIIKEVCFVIFSWQIDDFLNMSALPFYMIFLFLF
jgi:hypothetical protein